MDTQFVCDCGKAKIEKALIAVGKKELKDMIDDGKEIEVNCHFCSKHYVFSVEELKTLYRKAQR
jgi:molecular chaperone Hsp33